MYGFGDDRNPSNDTVNVMEEILIEYITDVVSRSRHFSLTLIANLDCSAKSPGPTPGGHDCLSKTFAKPYLTPLMRRNWPVWKSSFSCKKTSSEPEECLTKQRSRTRSSTRHWQEVRRMGWFRLWYKLSTALYHGSLLSLKGSGWCVGWFTWDQASPHHRVVSSLIA
jgi:hypothetical protein